MARQAAGRHGWPVDRATDRQAQTNARLALGVALRALRKNAGLTQEQVAHILGMKPNKVSEIENGHKGLRWYTVVRYLAAVNATHRQLADEIERPPAAADHPASNGAVNQQGRAKPRTAPSA